MPIRQTLQRLIRPSTTRSTTALWAKSLLNAVMFFSIFMIALPWAACRVLPFHLPLADGIRAWIAALLALTGVAAWVACLDVFSRKGRGTPLPADAPRRLVTTGLFGRLRNPIMAAELLVIWAEAIYLAVLGVVLYAIAMSVLAHLMIVRVEEPELRDRFGASYTEYCRKVPRWLPRTGRRA